jgi:rod shape-determining protein MreC
LQKKSGDTPLFARPFVLLAGYTQQAYSTFSTGIRGTTALYLNLVDVKKQNRLMTKENLELRAQLGALEELKLENERFSRLLQFKESSNLELLSAQIVGKDLIGEHDAVTINRGITHGVKKGMAAIAVGGLVGYIHRLQQHTAQVILVTDRYSAVDALVQRSRVRGIIEGRAYDLARLSYLRRSDDVAVGDLIVTSGLQPFFPKGFPIGTVTGVRSSRYGLGKEVDVKPIVNPSLVEELFIVTKVPREETAPTAEPLSGPLEKPGEKKAL